MELHGACEVKWLREARRKLKDYDRIAGLQPSSADAKRVKYVYGLSRISWDEFCRDQRGFRYTRYQIVRETRKFLFVSTLKYDNINRDEEVAPSLRPLKRSRWA